MSNLEIDRAYTELTGNPVPESEMRAREILGILRRNGPRYEYDFLLDVEHFLASSRGARDREVVLALEARAKEAELVRRERE